MERLGSAVPPAAKKSESNHKPTPTRAVRKENSPKRVDKLKPEPKKEQVSTSQQASHDFDMALAALHSGDYEAAAALVEKLRRSSQDDPNSYGLAVVQLGLLVQEGKDCAQRHKTKSALQAFAKQSRPIQPPESPAVDRSV